MIRKKFLSCFLVLILLFSSTSPICFSAAPVQNSKMRPTEKQAISKLKIQIQKINKLTPLQVDPENENDVDYWAKKYLETLAITSKNQAAALTLKNALYNANTKLALSEYTVCYTAINKSCPTIEEILTFYLNVSFFEPDIALLTTYTLFPHLTPDSLHCCIVKTLLENGFQPSYFSIEILSEIFNQNPAFSAFDTIKANQYIKSYAPYIEYLESLIDTNIPGLTSDYDLLNCYNHVIDAFKFHFDFFEIIQIPDRQPLRIVKKPVIEAMMRLVSHGLEPTDITLDELLEEIKNPL